MYKNKQILDLQGIDLTQQGEIHVRVVYTTIPIYFFFVNQSFVTKN